WRMEPWPTCSATRTCWRWPKRGELMSKLGLESETETALVLQAAAHSAPSRLLAEYAADLSLTGVRILPGDSGTFWTAYGTRALMRQPAFYSAAPSNEEVRRVLWQARALVATYMLEADGDHPANAWLYVCSDHNYRLEKLDRSKRGHVRTGLREL